MADDQQVEQKKHAACDECRTRKLKCSGDTPDCQRCRTERIKCIYSPRKQMGRPRKRARDNDTTADEQHLSDAGVLSPFTFRTQEPMVGIPGTGIPLVPISPDANFEALLDPSIQWLDPLRGFGASEPAPWIIGSEDTPQILSHDLDTTSRHNALRVDDFTTPAGTCMCLSNLYMTLSNLSTTKAWSFPMSVHKLKTAMNTSDFVLNCQICPQETTTAMQNLMMLTTLLTTVTECYRKILLAIEAHAAEAEVAGTTIQYRMGDSSPERWHLHTGTDNCPMGINVDFEPGEYKMIARKVIRADVVGAANSPMGRISILDLVKRLEERQKDWHSGGSSIEMRRHFASAGQQCDPANGDFTCLKLVGMIRHHVGLLGL